MARNVLIVIVLTIPVLLFARALDSGHDDPVEPYRTSLEALAELQTRYQLDNGHYTKAPRFEGYRTEERYIQVAVDTVHLGWAATARRRGQPHWGCVYRTERYEGPLTTPGGKPAKAFTVVCDDGPPPESPLRRKDGDS